MEDSLNKLLDQKRTVMWKVS